MRTYNEMITLYRSRLGEAELHEEPVRIPLSEVLGEEAVAADVAAFVFEPLHGMLLSMCRPFSVQKDVILPCLCLGDPQRLAFGVQIRGRSLVRPLEGGQEQPLGQDMFFLGRWVDVPHVLAVPRQETFAFVGGGLAIADIASHFGKSMAKKLDDLLLKHLPGKGIGYATGLISAECGVAARRLLQEPAPHKTLDVLTLRSRALELFAAVCRSFEDSLEHAAGEVRNTCRMQDDLEAMESLKAYIAKHALSISAVGDLCERAGMSESKCNKLFKNLFGVSPGVYVRRCKLEHAYARLRARRCNVNEAAQEAGYSNVGYFIAQFRKHFGLTPREAMLLEPADKNAVVAVVTDEA